MNRTAHIHGNLSRLMAVLVLAAAQAKAEESATPRRIVVSVAKPAAEEVALRMAAEEAHRREVKERAERSASVRAAIDILGGEVTDVRPRSRGGKA